MKLSKKVSFRIVCFVILGSILLILTKVYTKSSIEEERLIIDLGVGGYGLTILGAALAVFLSGIGSAIGIGYVGQAALGAMSYDTKNFSRYLILTALPGTQGIYGFVGGFLILQWSGIMAGSAGALTIYKGAQFLFASLPVGMCGLLSAIHQGKVCTAGIGMVSKKPEEVGKALVLGVFVEFYAVLGLLLTILMLLNIKVI